MLASAQCILPSYPCPLLSQAILLVLYSSPPGRETGCPCLGLCCILVFGNFPSPLSPPLPYALVWLLLTPATGQRPTFCLYGFLYQQLRPRGFWSLGTPSPGDFKLLHGAVKGELLDVIPPVQSCAAQAAW